MVIAVLSSPNVAYYTFVGILLEKTLNAILIVLRRHLCRRLTILSICPVIFGVVNLYFYALCVVDSLFPWLVLLKMTPHYQGCIKSSDHRMFRCKMIDELTIEQSKGI